MNAKQILSWLASIAVALAFSALLGVLVAYFIAVVVGLREVP